MIIGSVRELMKQEDRVGLTPDNVREYVDNGHTVYIEQGAGLGSGFSDEQYEQAGATVLQDAAEVWQRADMMVKVKDPLASEYDLMRRDQIIFTYLHLAASKALTEAMLARGVNGVAYETIRDAKGSLPCLKPMSEIAGRLSIQIGARCLEKPHGGPGLLLGGVPGVRRAHVVVVGGGVVGASACKMAIGLGAQVTILDNSLDRLDHLEGLFGQSAQTMFSTAGAIEKALQTADLVIGAVLIPGSAAPKLIKREYLKNMKEGSVIVDVAVDQGGCCETTRLTYHDNPTFVLDGVIHYGVGNMPGAVAQTSTVALTNATLAYGIKIANLGLEEAARRDEGLARGINTYQGRLTFKGVADALSLPFEPLPFID